MTKSLHEGGSPEIEELGDFSRHEQLYREYLASHPDASFAHFCSARVASRIADGTPHESLGGNLRRGGDWWEAGISPYRLVCSLMNIQPSHRVMDYGCGTLRVGGHFIRSLDPGHYAGMELLEEYLQIGRELVGAELLAEKKPLLLTISDANMARAERFEADVVIAIAVADNVHPGECATFFDNLKRLAARPGAVVCFSATITDSYYRAAFRSWSRPLEFYRDWMSPFDLKGDLISPRPKDVRGRSGTAAYLLFGNPA